MSDFYGTFPITAGALRILLHSGDTTETFNELGAKIGCNQNIAALR